MPNAVFMAPFPTWGATNDELYTANPGKTHGGLTAWTLTIKGSQSLGSSYRKALSAYRRILRRIQHPQARRACGFRRTEWGREVVALGTSGVGNGALDEHGMLSAH